MNRLSRIIKENHFVVALVLLFSLMVALTPFFYFNILPNRYLGMLALRCLVLDSLSAALFLLLEGGRFRRLALVGFFGALTALLYLGVKLFFLLVPCLAATITTVVMVALVAFSLIEVNYRD